jgi:hypothetical protein
MAEFTVHRTNDWLSAMVGDELVMMNAVTGNYVTVSRVGSRIWELLERPRSVDDLCDRLVREFEVTPETCRADVRRFLDEMASNGAVAFDPAAVA